jgi:hypothetical protein
MFGVISRLKILSLWTKNKVIIINPPKIYATVFDSSIFK